MLFLPWVASTQAVRNDLSRSLLTCILILYRVIWYLSYIDILVYTWWIVILYIFMLNKFCLSPESWAWVHMESMITGTKKSKLDNGYMQNWSAKIDSLFAKSCISHWVSWIIKVNQFIDMNSIHSWCLMQLLFRVKLAPCCWLSWQCKEHIPSII